MQASGWRPQNWLMSETAVAAALTASIAPTDGSADFGCELPVGSSAKTMLSQNAVRNRKNITTVPFRGLCPAAFSDNITREP